MSHEITKDDGLVLTGKPAWHGLGVVVQDAPSPQEALQIAGLDWSIEQADILCRRKQIAVGEDGQIAETLIEQPITEKVANVRADTGLVLGVVGDAFSVIQNRDLIPVIKEAAENEGVTIESAGSLRGGREVWFLAHLSTFMIGERDKSHMYAMFLNGHDGSRSLTVFPTGVRVVCNNTKSVSLRQADNAGLSVNLRHTRNLHDRIPAIQASLRGAASMAKREQEKAEKMAAARLSDAEVNSLFVRIYERLYGAFPRTRDEAPAKWTRGHLKMESWLQTMHRECRTLNTEPSAWMVANAVTGWIEHARTGRKGVDRTHTQLLGQAATAKEQVFQTALASLQPA